MNAQEEMRKKAGERMKKPEKPADKPLDRAPSTVPTQPTPPATAGEFVRRLTRHGESGQSDRMWKAGVSENAGVQIK
jgi:hypothetical protein